MLKHSLSQKFIEYEHVEYEQRIVSDQITEVERSIQQMKIN